MARVRARLNYIIPLTLFLVGLLLYANTRSLIKTAIVALAVPFWLIRTKAPAWQALLGGFALANLLAFGAIGLLTYISWDWVAGLIWFFVKSFMFVFVFVWMRGTFPRVRVDQLMGFAWKWLLPAALLNLFVTALAIIVVKSL